MQPESDRLETPTWSSEQELVQPYRAVSRAAVAAAFLTVLGLLSFLAPFLLVLPALGVVLGLIGLVNVRRFPEELTGRGTAIASIVACILMTIGATSWHVYIFATEVPPGHQRVYFRTLQVPTAVVNPRPPAEALALDGQKVFIKGYVHPDAGMSPVSEFVLVPDMSTCCFGGQPKLTDMIQVKLSGNQKIRYSTRTRKLAGLLSVDSKLTPVKGYIGVYYRLEATHAK